MMIYRDYPCNACNYQRGRTQPIKYLVIHYVGATGGAKANVQYYGSAVVESSAHYYMGHASEGAPVYQSVAEPDTAWHCGRSDGKYVHPECRNSNSIGIEMCCHQRADGTWYMDPETVDRTVELAKDIMARYGIDIAHVLRHYDVTGKLCPRPWVDNPAAWETFKMRLEDNEMTKDEIKAMVKDILVEELAERDAVVAQAAQKVSPWASESWDKAVAKGVFDGTRPGGTLTREQAATVFDRLGLLERSV